MNNSMPLMTSSTNPSVPESQLPEYSSRKSVDQAGQHPGRQGFANARGYTLIELMIVLLIVGIIATGVVFMFANPSAKSKNQAFTLMGDLNMARSEAVSRNENVLVDFIEGSEDGYQICVDSTGVNGCSDESGDNFIRETIFREEVQYYDPDALPTDGPATTPTAGSTPNNLIGGSGILLDDATAVTSFTLESDGTLDDTISKNINVVIFVPKGSHKVISGVPYAVVVSASTGRIRINRWTEGAWKTK